MGQKTSATIFRLGFQSNGWESKYLGNLKHESSIYSYENLNLRKYLHQFFKMHGLLLHTCKINFSETSLELVIAYYTTFKALFLINEINLNQKIAKIKKRKYQKHNLKKSNKKFKNYKQNRLRLLKYYKNASTKNIYNNTQILNNNAFIKKLLNSITLFTKQKRNIFLTLQNLNKGSSTTLNKNQVKELSRTLAQFRKNINTKFFKETINVVLISILKKESAQFFSIFVSNQLSKFSKSKRQRFFLILLKRLLKAFFKTSLVQISGIKITVKGRINGAPRTKKHEIIVGKVPFQSIKTKINYYQSVSYSQNGTFGVKVWIAETKNLCFYNQKNQNIKKQKKES